MGSYFAQTCPAGYRDGGEGGGSGSGSGKSGDNGYQYDVSYTETTRYAKVKGYGYATDRCVCYTDGSGCDCDDQDEKTAVLNVASYGPAAVCLEASLWQDYEGGIMTSDIGCSSSFLDMNHCGKWRSCVFICFRYLNIQLTNSSLPFLMLQWKLLVMHLRMAILMEMMQMPTTTRTQEVEVIVAVRMNNERDIG